MKDKKKQDSGQPLSRKEARKLVNQKMALALAEYQGIFSEKKFRVKLKKASKLFATGILKAANKKKSRPVVKTPSIAQ